MNAADWKPMEVSDVDLAFPARALELMPSMEDLPEPLNDENGYRDHPAMGLVRRLLFGPEIPKGVQFYAVSGVNAEMAYRHIMVVAGSFAPKHEHKEAVMALFISLWFKKVIVPKDDEEDEVLWRRPVSS